MDERTERTRFTPGLKAGILSLIQDRSSLRSHEAMTTSGIMIRRFEDGKIAEEWVMEDTLALMQQLGVVDPPGA